MEISQHNLRHGRRSPQLVLRWEQRQNQFFLYCTEMILEISVIEENIIRFRYSPEGFFEQDFSYAIATEGGMPESTGSFEWVEVGDRFELITRQLRITISKSLHVAIYEVDGALISEDERGFFWDADHHHGGHVVHHTRKIQEGECFFGLGDKPNRLNLRGSRFETWGSDTYGFERTTDPLYKNIPFFQGLNHGRAYGIFFDNSFRTVFDFGHERSDVCSMWSHGGEMNYYFIYGPELSQVVEGFHHLTGKPELPPLWALGYHQSRWSYYPENKVKEIAAKFRELSIPCDAIHIDIEYMDGYRCFTWNAERFPDPKRLAAELAADGFKSIAILDPGIKIDPEYKIYQEGIEQGYFCRRADGPLMKGNVWPGACHFPDFTNPKVRDWWAGLVAEFMAMGIHGIWNDMNEPAVLEVGTFPMDTRHDYDGQPCSHRKAHNVYGMQMARASYHGMKQAVYPRRPFALTRSGYAGVQRYAATWTGDNVSSWEHLWMASLQCQRLSISGLSFCGSDVGGFIGNCHGELLTRWTQLGVFHPLFRNHTSQDHSIQEPWVFGDTYTDAIRKAIELRYQLLPYIYTVFWRYVEYGTPMILPLVFMDQHDPQTYNRMDEFGFGSNLLICPVMGQGEEGRRMYLPEGKWYNYWTGEKHDGRMEFWVAAPIDQFPLFVRAGSTIPHYPVMNYVGEKEIEALDLHVYFEKGLNSSQLYEDAGDYYEYEQGNYMLRTFSLEGDATESRIIQRNKGRYNSEYPEFRFILKGWPKEIQSIQMDGKKVRFKESGSDAMGLRYEVLVDKSFEELKISC